jgi:polysaccharide export outer membrane protein
MLKLIKKIGWLIICTELLIGCASKAPNFLPDTKSSATVDYLIGPGDSLQIFVWRNPDLSTSVTVRPDGRISSPLVDDLDVAGRRVTDVGVMIEDLLSKYIRTPKVSVIVSTFNGPIGQQIRVIGNAIAPQTLSYQSGMTLIDVMIATGGLSEFADGDNAQLIRNKNGSNVAYTIELDALIREGDITKNRAVAPGDTIIIPESWF